jgi:hypothetical protein
MATRVKFFYGIRDLEGEINTWLSAQPSEIIPLHVAMCTYGLGAQADAVVSLWYKTESAEAVSATSFPGELRPD